MPFHDSAAGGLQVRKMLVVVIGYALRLVGALLGATDNESTDT